jgi:YVTN family beta-propeller protein
LKPDGGELFSANFNSHSVSIVETSANEVGGTYIVGEKPTRGIVTADNSTLYVSNFGSNSVTTYSIDNGKVLGAVQVGNKPDALALSGDESYLLVVNSGSADVAVVRPKILASSSKRDQARALVTMIPVGAQPNDIVVKAFTTK